MALYFMICFIYFCWVSIIYLYSSIYSVSTEYTCQVPFLSNEETIVNVKRSPSLRSLHLSFAFSIFLLMLKLLWSSSTRMKTSWGKRFSNRINHPCHIYPLLIRGCSTSICIITSIWWMNNHAYYNILHSAYFITVYLPNIL